MSELSGCPVKSVTCTNKPDSSENRCPGCPVTDGCNTQRGCYSSSAEPTSQWTQEPEATSDLTYSHVVPPVALCNAARTP